jgi:hypothetical protein
VSQLVDYYGMLKSRFPEKPVELMVIANRIPPERRLACEQYHIDAVEIPQKKFRDVAEEVGYVFAWEKTDATPRMTSVKSQDRAAVSSRIASELPLSPAKIEKSWYYWKEHNGRGYFLAFVNAKGSCSMRRFDAAGGAFLGREYKSGDYQESFSEYVASALLLHISRQPNLERDCKNRLPAFILSELMQQTSAVRGES